MGGAVITSVGAGVSGGVVAMGGAVSGGRVNPGVGASVLFVPASTTVVVDVARSSSSSSDARECNISCKFELARVSSEMI
jgi:hypothetical protein